MAPESDTNPMKAHRLLGGSLCRQGPLLFFPSSPLSFVFVCFWSPFVFYLPFPSLLFPLFFLFISFLAPLPCLIPTPLFSLPSLSPSMSSHFPPPPGTLPSWELSLGTCQVSAREGAPFATPREISSHPRLHHTDQMSGKILHLKISPWMFLKQMDDCIQEYPFPRTFSVCR